MALIQTGLAIKKIKLLQVKIPFSVQVSHNLAKRAESQGFIVQITDSFGNRGYGEGTPRQYVTGETSEGCQRALVELAGLAFNSLKDPVKDPILCLQELGSSPVAKDSPSAFCAIELAILDLVSKRLNIPLYKLFKDKPATNEIIYSSIVPILPLDQVRGLLKMTKELGMEYVKMKASGIDESLQVLNIIHQVVGPEINVRIDANAAFDKFQAIKLVTKAREKGLEISAFEQPVPKLDLIGMKQVEEQGGIPVIADESMCSQEDLEEIITKRACSGINVRLSKCGGFLKSVKITNRAKDSGLFCQLGCHVGETSILSAAARHLVAVCGPYRFTEGSYSRFLLEQDIVKNPCNFGKGGIATIPDKPGLGIEVDEGALNKYTRPITEISC